MATADTIAAVATAPGRGGIGVVRVSGAALASLAEALTGFVPAARLAARASFLDANRARIDEGLVLYFPAPNSFTGEDVLELHGHGGPVVMNMLLSRCIELGARLAEPGEFTRRAFLNDKLDLAQAEAVADLIDAASARAVRSALRSLSGEFSARIESLAGQLVELRSLVEAMLDFPEEDIDTLDRHDAAGRLAALDDALQGVLSKARQGSVLRSGFRVVLAGRPNVGKSSLLNALAGEDLAIVTPIAGTTRDSVRETITIEGVPLNIVDTAGLRTTSDEVERHGIERTWREIGAADVLLLVCDCREGLLAEDRAVLEAAPAALARIVVFNKIDLGGEAPGRSVAGAMTEVRLSAKSGQGMDELRGALLQVAGMETAGEDVFLARERHLVALRAAAGHVARARTLTGNPELFAEELRLAHLRLAAITGEFSADDLLGEIFARFCIGK